MAPRARRRQRAREHPERRDKWKRPQVVRAFGRLLRAFYGLPNDVARAVRDFDLLTPEQMQTNPGEWTWARGEFEASME